MKYLQYFCFLLFPSYIAAQPLSKMNYDQAVALMTKLYLEQKFEAALPVALKCIELSEGNDSLQAIAYTDITQVYSSLGQMDKVLEPLQKALALRKKALGEKHPDYIENLGDLIFYYDYSGQFTLALEIAEQEKKLKGLVFGKENSKYAQSLILIGIVLINLDRYEEAEQNYLDALEIYKKSKSIDSSGYTGLLNNIGMLYEKTNRYEESESFYKQACELRKAFFGANSPDYSTALNNLAVLYDNSNRLDEAEALYKICFDIESKYFGLNHPQVAIIYNNLASIYSKQKKYSQSEDFYRKATAIWKKEFGDRSPRYATSIFGLGELLISHFENRTKEGISLLEKATEIIGNELGKKHENYIHCLNTLGAAATGLNNYEEAASLYKQALSANLVSDVSPKITDIKQISAAEFNHSIKAIESLTLYQRLYISKYKRSGEKSQLDTAFLLVKNAIAICNNYRHKFHSEQDKLRILSKLNELVQLIFKLGSKTANPSLVSELFNYAEFNKSVLLLDATKKQRAYTFGDLPDSLAQTEIKLGMDWDKLKKLALEANTADAKNDIIVQINSVNIEIDAFKKKIEKSYPKYYKYKYNTESVKTEELQKLLNNKTMLLEYFVSDSTVYLFSITTKSVLLLPLEIDQKELKERTTALRKSLTDYSFIKEKETEAYNLYIESAYWFYKNLLKPALNEKNIENLIIVTDNELGHLPFEAFLTESVGSKLDYSELPYLLHKYKISYNYSATLWKENLDNPVVSPNGKLLAIAAKYGEKENAIQNRGNCAPHLRNLRDKLQDLPAAREEVITLSKLFAGKFLYENEANEKNFKKIAGQFGIIHLAMHGILNQSSPLLSALAFTENGDSTNDNFLEAWEISHLKLNAQLVVLSACETGYGKFQQGEGVMSLARSFMYAGVPSLVMSLWQVNDASTSLIMQLFYKNLAKGVDKAEALQKAKLDYIKLAREDNDMTAHPAFWAAFVLLGDERPIALAAKGGGSFWWIIGGVLFLTTAVGFFVLRGRKEK